MKGILLISHGRLAEGMADSAALFLGDGLPQFDWLCLEPGDSAHEFGNRIMEKASELDTGEGVIVLADICGGTPSNQTIPGLSEKLDLITGVNLSLLVQLLTEREYGQVSVPELVEAGRKGIMDMKAAMAQAAGESHDWL